MPRPTRLFLPGQTHHVIQRGNNRCPIFFDEVDRALYLRWLGEAARSLDCAIHAYVLMTNHVHLLVTPAAAHALPRLLQSLGRRYVQHVNRTYGRTGTLWEGRYKSTILDSETYVLACYRYIEANPLRAGMCARPEDHRWSTYAANALGQPDKLVTPHPVYRALGRSLAARREAYRALFDAVLAEEIVATLRDATQRGWVPGNDPFRAEIAQALARKVDVPRQGRPPKVREEMEEEQGELL